MNARMIESQKRSRLWMSPIEVALLAGLANGLQSKELAQEIGRSTATVELYIRNLFLKFDARSRSHLVALAFCAGVLDSSVLGT
jgi:DNA-binding NarL/FixJ family response regulator